MKSTFAGPDESSRHRPDAKPLVALCPGVPCDRTTDALVDEPMDVGPAVLVESDWMRSAARNRLNSVLFPYSVRGIGC